MEVDSRWGEIVQIFIPKWDCIVVSSSTKFRTKLFFVVFFKYFWVLKKGLRNPFIDGILVVGGVGIYNVS